MHTLNDLTKLSKDLHPSDKLIAYEKGFNHSAGYSKVRVMSCFKNNKLVLECTNEHVFSHKESDDLTSDQMVNLSNTMLNVKNFFEKINSWAKETKYSGLSERLVENLNKEFKR